MSEVRYIDDEYDVTFVIRKATVADGIRRGVLIAQQEKAFEEYRKTSEDDPLALTLRRLYQTLYYPSLLCGTAEIINNDADKPKQLSLNLSAEEFLSLPESLFETWAEGVWKQNPQWAPRFFTEGEQGNRNEPGAGNGSTNASAPGSKPNRNRKQHR